MHKEAPLPPRLKCENYEIRFNETRFLFILGKLPGPNFFLARLYGCCTRALMPLKLTHPCINAFIVSARMRQWPLVVARVRQL